MRSEVYIHGVGRRSLRAALALVAGLLLSVQDATAQEDPEYRMEIGAGVGLVNYLGDYNGNLLKNQQPMGCLTAKYRPNPRSAWAFSLGYGKLKGDIKDSQTWYPEQPEDVPTSFGHSVVDGGVRFEYNFWAYGTGREYRGARRVAPFIALGLGITYASVPGKGVTTLNMPIGAGVKYKLKDRLNLTAEWRMHFGGSDRLDGVSDPYGIKSSGLFKNTDCYGVLQVAVTYDIWAKCKTCNNDRD